MWVQQSCIFAGKIDIYRGQVALIKPNFLDNRNVSHSHGVVRIAKGSSYEPWWFVYLSPKELLSQNTADTMCRQMGYTHAVLNSIMNKTVNSQVYGYNYNLSYT